MDPMGYNLAGGFNPFWRISVNFLDDFHKFRGENKTYLSCHQLNKDDDYPIIYRGFNQAQLVSRISEPSAA